MVNNQPYSDALPDKKFQLIGGDLCLDFCNTVGGKREGIPRENLHSYLHFLAWCEQVGLVSESQRDLLKAKALEDKDSAARALSRVIELREAIYRICMAIARRDRPSMKDLGVLNAELAHALGRLRIGPKQEGTEFEWKWSEQPLELLSPVGPLAHGAARLLVTKGLTDHVHQCGGENCGWLFLDSSKNHSRRWCDMRDCGNRAKVRRHRRKQSSTTPGSHS